MNNNRGNSRRRGRGSNRQQGGQQLNRIDSRARGNAAQLLEKYRKLAHDAHLNGDRVQEEYNLQFADHYFRVLADQKQRQEEARQPRREERSQGSDDDENPASVFEMRQTGGGRGDDRPDQSDDERGGDETGESEFEPADNPFVRDNRGGKPRKPRRRSREDDEGRGRANRDEDDASAGLDPSTLPPPISANAAEDADDSDVRPRRRSRRQPPAEDSGEALEAVN